jgi:hypothetical protein
MPGDSTRKLLKLFGVAVTECEDALARLQAAFEDAGPGSATALADALAAYHAASSELQARWGEVGRLVADYHAAAERATEAYVRARAGSR